MHLFQSMNVASLRIMAGFDKATNLSFFILKASLPQNSLMSSSATAAPVQLSDVHVDSTMCLASSCAHAKEVSDTLIP